MKDYLGFFHPVKSAIAGLGAVVGYLVTLESIVFQIPLLLTFLSVFLITSGIFVLSDFLDLEKDRLENPDKPLPSGSVNKNVAKSIFGLQITAGIALAFFISNICFILALVGTSLSLVYEYFMKRSTPFYDDLLLGFLVGSLFLYGGIAAGGSPLSAVIALIVSLAFVGRKILKDTEMETEVGTKRVTLASYLGNKFAAWTASAFLVAAVFLTPVTHLLGMLGNNHLFILSIGDVLLVYAAIKIIDSPSSGKEARMISEIGLFFLVVSYLTVLV